MMENLINDLLDLAKLNRNQFVFSKEYFNLSTTIYESFQILHQSAKSKGINLEAEIDQKVNLDLIQSVLGDQRRYQQILLNFLSNSLKFTNSGGNVKIRIEILSHQAVKKDKIHKDFKEKVIK